MHIVKIQHICGIQSDSVDIKFADPETDDIADIVFDIGIVLIQLDKQIVTTPVLITEAVIVLIVAAEVYIAKPVTVG